MQHREDLAGVRLFAPDGLHRQHPGAVRYLLEAVAHLDVRRGDGALADDEVEDDADDEQQHPEPGQNQPGDRQPRPPWPCLALFNPTMPQTTLMRMPPRTPKISETIAHQLVCFGGGA